MKGRNYQWFSIIFSSLFILSSCTVLSRKKPFSNKASKGKAALPSTVSAEQYNALLKRYEGLQDELRDLKTRQNEKNREVDKQVEIADSSSRRESVRTVDVFSEGGISPKQAAKKRLVPVDSKASDFVTELTDHDAKMLEIDIFELNKARTALEQGQYQQGIDILGKLQKSRYRQIQVRAQFLIGENLFRQEEFNLALQAYEEIIHRNAFSGLILKTLERAIVCTEKLGIKDKQDQYYSILHDFFEGS